jgi:hypothetical protein
VILNALFEIRKSSISPYQSHVEEVQVPLPIVVVKPSGNVLKSVYVESKDATTPVAVPSI